LNANLQLNADLMSQYIKYIADRLLTSLGYNKIYNEQNPFDWMEAISLTKKGNFFEVRVSNYKKSGVGLTVEQNSVSFDADF